VNVGGKKIDNYFCIMAKKNKERLNVVYSTNPNFNYEVESEEEQNTLAPQFQKLYVSIDKKQRAGKEVTLVEGFIGAEEDLKELGKLLKSKCGVGGTVKENEILIQGNFRDKIMEILIKEGYQVKRKGG
jgi:translation initiation factor 1